MAAERDWSHWLNVAGSLASLTALGYLLTHLPRRGRSITVAGLGRSPPAVVFENTKKTQGGSTRYRIYAKNAVGEVVGKLTASADCQAAEYAEIEYGWTAPEVRGQGLYPGLLSQLRDVVKADGCMGVVSRGSGRISKESTASWRGFKKREPRIREDLEEGDFYFEGLRGLPVRRLKTRRK